MTSDSDIVDIFMQKRKQNILDLQKGKGIFASGLSAELLRTEDSGNIHQLIDAAGYFEQQEFGKAPGPTPFNSIYEWLALKKYGFDWKDDKERRQMAWAILANHKRYGSFVYRRRTPTGVLSEAINDALLDELISQLSEKKKTEISTDVVKLLSN